MANTGLKLRSRRVELFVARDRHRVNVQSMYTSLREMETVNRELLWSELIAYSQDRNVLGETLRYFFINDHKVEREPKETIPWAHSQRLGYTSAWRR